MRHTLSQLTGLCTVVAGVVLALLAFSPPERASAHGAGHCAGGERLVAGHARLDTPHWHHA